MIQPLTPWSQPRSRYSEPSHVTIPPGSLADIFADAATNLLPPKGKDWTAGITALRFVAGAIIVSLAFLTLLVYLLTEKAHRALVESDFRTFDRRATALGKWVLFAVGLYLGCVLYAAWRNGAFDRLVR